MNRASWPRTVLLVDDDDDLREVVGMLLETEGYRVRTASDGIEALQYLDADGSVALIIIDLMMPRMDGARLIERLRSDGRRPVPIVVMSGHDGAAEQARALGADRCVVKPIDADDLFRVVEHYLAAADEGPDYC